MNKEIEQAGLASGGVAQVPDGFELVDGELVEKNVGAESSYVGGELAFQLKLFCRERGTGWVFPADTGYRCFPDQPKLVRKPDVSFVRSGRLPDGRLPTGDFTIAPDLAAEVVSPNDLYEEVEKKVAEYRSAGVRLVWVISPTARTVLIRRPDGSAAEIGEGGELSGEDVIPGFRCRVADLFRPPAGAT